MYVVRSSTRGSLINICSFLNISLPFQGCKEFRAIKTFSVVKTIETERLFWQPVNNDFPAISSEASSPKLPKPDEIA